MKIQIVPLIIVFAIFLGLSVVSAQSMYISSYQPVSQSTTKPADFKKIIQPNAFFYTKDFVTMEKTYISFPYRFDGDIPLVWLSLATVEGTQKINRLVSHPVLHELDWAMLQTDDLTLYQKEPTFDTIEAFLANPPESENIMIDPDLYDRSPFSSIKATTLDVDSNLENIDYLLTTYKPSKVIDDIFYYQVVIDASIAQVTKNSELDWLLLIPFATEENPFYIGDIHVDYRQ